MDNIIHRPRRLRQEEVLRSLLRENRLTIESLIYPLFIRFGRALKEEIKSMPGQYRFSLDELEKEVKELFKLGIKAVLLFGLPEKKDELGRGAYTKKGIVQKAVKVIKKTVPEMVVATDVCLCAYTNHGHCGIVNKRKVLNDETLELLAKTAVSHAEAGADIVAPSAMMDAQVRAIRKSLDEAGLVDTIIMSYSAKYSSAFYGPFREAADSAPKFGDRKSYQMDSSNIREAIKEIEMDIDEGADIVMVKPALAYLDVISEARKRFNVPIAAFSVSGEYVMVKAASANGFLDEKNIILEILTSIKRAGADIVITYFAKDVARWLNKTTYE